VARITLTDVFFAGIGEGLPTAITLPLHYYPYLLCFLAYNTTGEQQ
jgi:hypothetical protein